MTTENNKKPSDAAMRAADTIVWVCLNAKGEMTAGDLVAAVARNIDGAWNEMASALDTPTNPIKPGDVVTLASGGARWTVTGVTIDNCGDKVAGLVRDDDGHFLRVAMVVASLRKVEHETRASSDNAPYVYDDTVATRALNSLVDFLWDMFPNEKTAMGKDGAAAVAIRLLSDQQPMDEETHRHIYDVVKEWTKAWDDEPRASILQNWLDAQGVK